MMGFTVTQVTYDYELKDVAAWTANPEIRGAFTEMTEKLAQPKLTDTNALVLTSEGWKDEHEINAPR
ncbi:MAG TPA: hypothetical protein VGJ20_19735 [Xanthobacteraceae bacterium]|jgi:hypothetical protein